MAESICRRGRPAHELEVEAIASAACRRGPPLTNAGTARSRGSGGGHKLTATVITWTSGLKTCAQPAKEVRTNMRKTKIEQDGEARH
uniref:Uncharacterized protein n=1 Tax=Oryza rufipogon TaxID=4529 RepID=A0A0E0NLF6_ORYRU